MDIKRFENYEQNVNSNYITIRINEDTIKEGYWSVYYPVSNAETVVDTMSFEDWKEMILDIIEGEIRNFISNNYFKINSNYSKKLHNNNIMIADNIIRYAIEEELETLNKIDIEELSKFIENEILGHLSNSKKSIKSVKFEISINHDIVSDIYKEFDTKEEGFSDEDLNNFTQEELLNLIDDALDNNDMERVKEIGKYINENKIILKYKFYKSL